MIYLVEDKKPIRLFRKPVKSKPKQAEIKTQKAQISQAKPQQNDQNNTQKPQEANNTVKPGYTMKTCITYSDGHGVAQHNDKMQLIMFPCPIINKNNRLEPALNTSHYGIVLPQSMIERINDKLGPDSLNYKSGYLPVVMNTTNTGSENPINTNNSLSICLADYFNGKSTGASKTNILPNLICSIQPGALVRHYGYEKDNVKLNPEDLEKYLARNNITFSEDNTDTVDGSSVDIDKSSNPTGQTGQIVNGIDLSEVNTLQDLIILALSFNSNKQYINYSIGEPGEEKFGVGSWTHGGELDPIPLDKWSKARKIFMRNNNIQENIICESFAAHGFRALNECLKANIEDGWMTVLLIA